MFCSNFKVVFVFLHPDGKVAKIVDFPSYNAVFKHPNVHTSVMTGCSSTDKDPVDRINSLPYDGSNDTFDIRGAQLPTLNIELNDTSDFVDVDKTLTPESKSSVNNCNAVHIGDNEQEITHEDIAQDVIFEFLDQQNDNASKSKCNCCQKLLNKMDYMQKKFLKEVGRYRQETLQAIRQFSDKYEVLLKSQEFNTPEVANQAASQAKNDEFEVQFKNLFPVLSKLALIEINETIRTERDFKRRLTSKLKCIAKEKKENETKVTRLLLKSICSSICLSDFTWLGTEKKGSFSELEALIEVMTSVVEFYFPGCDAFKTVKQVVQQRTKSAAEAEKQLKNPSDVLESEYLGANNSTDPVDNASPSGMEKSVPNDQE